FFVQAEDGIRDWSVTGVQTCALPICLDLARGGVDRLGCELELAEAARGARPGGAAGEDPRAVLLLVAELDLHVPVAADELVESRSEERRVGEEGRGQRRAEQLVKEGR